MNRNAIETVMGAVVLVVAAVFLFFAYTTSQVRAVRGYELTASFLRVEGLRNGGDVRLNGIKIGTIISQELDEEYWAVVRMSIDRSIKLPADSVAAIASSGLLGDKYLSIERGAEEDDLLKDGGKIAHTVPAINLESIIKQVVFGMQNAQPKKDDAAPPK